LHRYSVNIILTIFKLISIMKKLIFALAIAAFGAATSFAQAPAAPAAAVKAAPAAAAQAAPAAAEVKKAAPKAKKAHAKHAAHADAAGAAKMAYQCPKGCALVDAAGKCPKCGTELVAIGGGAAKKAEKAKAPAAAAPAAVKEEVKK
jgi:Cu/Ag efflux protein CusF